MLLLNSVAAGAWTTANGSRLSPNTGDALGDNVDRAVRMGEMLPLNLDVRGRGV